MATVSQFVSSIASGFDAVAGQRNRDVASLSSSIAAANGKADAAAQDAAAVSAALNLLKGGTGLEPTFATNLITRVAGAGTQDRNVLARLLDHGISVADFVGFVPNNTASSHVAFQNAINLAQTLKCRLLLPSAFRLDQGVEITAPLEIAGVGAKTKIELRGTGDTISIKSSDVVISNLEFDEYNKTAGWQFNLVTSLPGSLERITIDNVLGWHSKGGLRDSGPGIHITVLVRGYYNRIVKGTHVKLERSFGYLKLDDCTADFNGSGAAGNFPSFVMTGTGLGEGAGGGVFSRCHVLGSSDSALTNSHGFVFTDYNAAWFVGDVTADGCGGSGYIFVRCNKIEGEITVSLCRRHGIVFDTSKFSTLTINGQGAKGLTTALADQDLIRFVGANTSISLILGYLADPTGNHVNVVGTQEGPINIMGGICSGSIGRALVATGSSVVQWTAFVWTGSNAGGNYSIASTLHWVEGVFASGGRTTFNGPGSA